MGSGFKFDKGTHEQFHYNCLEKISKHELNTMRTKYLIRDFWTLYQLKQLKQLYIIFLFFFDNNT